MTNHIPVMLKEALEGLQVKVGHWYIDATFGRGGHTKEILAQGGNVIALDHDADAITYGKQTFAEEEKEGRIVFYRTNFSELQMLKQPGTRISGILFDFGVSSPQFDQASRGFSFQVDAPLDMRMDDRLGVTAKDLINASGKKELIWLLEEHAQEHKAQKIAEAIIQERKIHPIETTKQLADLVEKAIGERGEQKRFSKMHPATKTFMALRLVVNDELGSIERTLPIALDTLTQGGRLVTISFHEGEDRLAKHAMQDWEERKLGMQMTKKPLQPSYDEIRVNPRCRSAKLRVFEKGLSI